MSNKELTVPVVRRVKRVGTAAAAGAGAIVNPPGLLSYTWRNVLLADPVQPALAEADHLATSICPRSYI
jgi:hypothetical protein